MTNPDKQDAQFDLQRKYRIRKIIEEKLEPWGKTTGDVDQDKADDPKDILIKVLKGGEK